MAHATHAIDPIDIVGAAHPSHSAILREVVMFRNPVVSVETTNGQPRDFFWWLRSALSASLYTCVFACCPISVNGQTTQPHWGGRINPFRSHLTEVAPSSTIAEFGKRIDCIAEEMRDDGLAILKQPDVYSQARMTKYRREFETEMVAELKSFEFVLNARVARLDAAAVDSQSSLAAAITPRGSTQAVTATAPTTVAPPVAPALQVSNVAPRFLSATALKVGQGSGNIGLEPTLFLDEKKRYLDHLHQIRRINLGDDVADSAGYGLYLVRMPLSITPGEKTVMGHGAEVAITAKHEFSPDFLHSTFRNLVINDLVDQLAPYVYERLRSDADRRAAVEAVNSERIQLRIEINALRPKIEQEAGPKIREQLLKIDGSVQPIAETPFFKQAMLFLLPDSFDKLDPGVAGRLHLLLDGARAASARTQMGITPGLAMDYTRYKILIDSLESGQQRSGADDAFLRERTLDFLERVLIQFTKPDQLDIPGLIKYLITLYDYSLPDDVQLLDALYGLGELAQVTFPYSVALQKSNQLKVRLTPRPMPSSRIAKRSYPIAPRELHLFFLQKNLDILANDAATVSLPQRPRATDVRSYIRQQLSVAYDLMFNIHPDMPTPPLADPFGQIDPITRLVLRRAFYGDGNARMAGMAPRTLDEAYGDLLLGLPANLSGTALGGLCWAIAVDAGLLDVELRHQVKVVGEAHGAPCPDLDAIRFYCPTPEASQAFNEYVRLRWPVIVFALDPVTDAQNILDSFSLRRDLQLALAFAFSTGKISFSQMNTFRRKIEQDAEAVALNRTVTSFAHGNETFGWRLTPRFQNPPSQSNIGVLSSTLLNGGPGANYGLRKSKIEPGQRELAAVIVLPSFLPTVRVEASSNWFRLDDPEHLRVHTRRMMELGRRVHELRQDLGTFCDAYRYRPTDVRFLTAKLDQVEAMLPIQSRTVQLPFDNAANGFDLFTEGTTALVPELSGFEGADRVIKGMPTSVILYGKNFSIHETRVVAGGRYLDAETKVEIISREVARVDLPGDVQPTFTYQEQAYVELYLATSTGISNRLLLPIVDERKSSASSGAGGGEQFPSGSKVTRTSANSTSTEVEFQVPSLPSKPTTQTPEPAIPTSGPAIPTTPTPSIESKPVGATAISGDKPSEIKGTPANPPAVDPATAIDPPASGTTLPDAAPAGAIPLPKAAKNQNSRSPKILNARSLEVGTGMYRSVPRPMILPPPPESDLPALIPGEALESSPGRPLGVSTELGLPPLPTGDR